MNRRAFMAAAGVGVLALPLGARAQPPAKPARLGLLGLGSADSTGSRLEALRAGLRELGYVEGKNVVMEYRWANGHAGRLPDLADELVDLKVDVLIAQGTAGARAAKRATATIPIVMTAALDAVGARLIVSIARPGGNITGTTIFSLETSAKQIDVLKEAMPRVTQLGLLLNPENPEVGTARQAMELAAQSVKMGFQGFEARKPDRIDAAFTAMARTRVDSVAIQQDPMFAANAGNIARLALRQRFPSIGDKEFAQAGGLIGHEMNVLEVWRRSAYFVDKILKGATPAELPVERIRKFEVTLNLKTAKALGVTIPPLVVAKADDVIR
ncbi:MAG TPA: ABC transporter substrate-binding protein [Terriglobales bacterium]|nr:ABC transporter substrate-binding protein [Terriglobales bacterium]